MPENRSNIPGSIKTPKVYATLRPGIELNGAAAGNSTIGLQLFNSNGHVIKGLVINRFSIAGIFAVNVTDTIIQGNYVGVDSSGTSMSPNGRGISVDGPLSVTSSNVTIGGLNTDERNVVSSSSVGTGIDLTNASNSKVLGNFVGTDIYGLAAFGNRAEGVNIATHGGMNYNASNNRAEYNLVLDDKTRSGMRLLGRKFLDSNCNILSDDQVINTVLVNNIVGVNLAGTPVRNKQGGLIINDDAQNSHVGFDMVDGNIIPMPNTFAGNTDGGIMIISSAPILCTSHPTDPAGHAFLYNTIYGNSTIGIDLTPVAHGASNFLGDGVTFNHPAGSSGPNNLQNYPVLDQDKSFANPALVQVAGALDSAPNSQYLIQVYSNESAVCKQLHVTPPVGYQPSAGCTVDPGYTTAFLVSQGEVIIGETVVTTDANGHVDFKFPAKLNSMVGPYLTSTATLLQAMPDGSLMPKDTSEFSQAIDISKKGSANAYVHADGAAGGDNGLGAVQGALDLDNE